jgi:hypothetical protein
MAKVTYTLIPTDAETFYSGGLLMTDESGQTWSIPIDPTNSDYQAYLASLDKPSK